MQKIEKNKLNFQVNKFQIILQFLKLKKKQSTQNKNKKSEHVFVLLHANKFSHTSK